MYSYDRQLILEDGTVYKGYGFGANTPMTGEVVFNTGMTGYQETLSDPSYNGQIVTFTYPLIGNYGINRDDFETINPSIKGLIVREVCKKPSNFRTEYSLDEVLKELIRIIIRLGIASRVTGLNEDTDITIDFDDSIIEDKQTERNEDRKDVSMGAMSLPEYRAKWYGETEEKAAARIPEQTGVIP